MLLPLLGIALGLVLLTYAADQFVVGAARIAARLRLSTVVIGAVVIGFGTSAPEMLVSGLASGRGSLDIAAGNIIGSNVANLSLVLGSAALLLALPVRSGILRREVPVSLLATLLFALLVQGGLERVEGAVLAVALVVALGVLVRSARSGDADLSSEVDEFLEVDGAIRLGPEVLRTLLGLGFTLLAAHVLVTSASRAAATLGLAEGFVGLTIVAIGTSLPELATSVQAARKGETDLIIGNLLGSNVFNSLAVGAVAGLVGPGPLQDASLAGLGVALMVGIALAASVFMVTGRRVVRWEGAALLAGYVSVLPFLA